MADWVVRSLDALGIESAALVGHSMGSLVAISAAARHPTRVRALGLIGTALAMGVSKDLLNAAAANDRSAVDMVNLWGFGARAGRGGADLAGLWMTGSGERILAASKPGILHNDLAACDAHKSVPEDAAAIVCPTLIVQGTRDMMTPIKSARALAAIIKGARVVELEGAGHMPMLEREEDVRRALGAVV
jgi:pimeloyl-ACP methyl ester carboxylesterase